MTGPIRPTPPIPMPPSVSGDDVGWLRSSFCGTGACVEVRRDGDTVLVRDSKLGDESPVQRWRYWLWDELLDAVKENADHVGVQQLGLLGRVVLGMEHESHAPLKFSAGEWFAFRKGVKDGEFDSDALTPASDRGVGADEVAVTAGQSAAACVTGEGNADTSSPVAPLVASMNSGEMVMDSPAGRGLSAHSPAADEPVRAGQPGPDPTAAALIRVIFDARERDPWDDVDEWAFGRAAEVYRAAFAAGFALARSGDGIPAWRSGPLTEHVPATLNDFEDSPATSRSGEAVTVDAHSVTAGGGEGVAPVPVGGPAGATEPHADCTCAGCEKCCLCGAP